MDEYLSQNRKPNEMKQLTINDKKYYIAYSPMDSWLAIPSGSAAYVFDNEGKMIDWSSDTGDDPEFLEEWYYDLQENIDIKKALAEVQQSA